MTRKIERIQKERNSASEQKTDEKVVAHDLANMFLSRIDQVKSSRFSNYQELESGRTDCVAEKINIIANRIGVIAGCRVSCGGRTGDTARCGQCSSRGMGLRRHLGCK